MKAADIARELAAGIDALVTDLLPNGHREGHEWRCGSIAGEPGSSLAVHLKGNKAGVWADFAGGIGGDALDLAAAVLGKPVVEAMDWSRRWLGIDEGEAAAPRRLAPPPKAAEPAADPDRWQRPWQAARPIAGTLAASYLAARGLEFDDQAAQVLRFAVRRARLAPDGGLECRPGAHAAEEPGGVKAQPPETPILGKQSNLALPPLVKPFLDALAAGESGGDYNVMYGDKPGQGTLGQYKQADAFGFPIWPGRMVWNKDKGIYEHTSAAGRYGFEHGTWDAEAAKLGLKDFSPASQDAAAWDLAKSDYFKRTHRDLMADYQAHRGSEIATALQPTWTSAGPRLAGMLDAGPRVTPGALADNSKPYADADTGYGERGPLGQTTVYGNGNQDFAGGTPGLVPAAMPGNLVPGGGADTSHNVNINLTGAPPGTRMAVNGTGPATVKTTTQFESSW